MPLFARSLPSSSIAAWHDLVFSPLSVFGSHSLWVLRCNPGLLVLKRFARWRLRCYKHCIAGHRCLSAGTPRYRVTMAIVA